DPAECGANGLSSRLDRNWDRTRRGSTAGIPGGTPDSELLVRGASFGRLDLCLGSAHAATHRAGCGAFARTQGRVHSAGRGFARRLKGLISSSASVSSVVRKPSTTED